MSQDDRPGDYDGIAEHANVVSAGFEAPGGSVLPPPDRPCPQIELDDLGMIRKPAEVRLEVRMIESAGSAVYEQHGRPLPPFTSVRHEGRTSTSNHNRVPFTSIASPSIPLSADRSASLIRTIRPISPTARGLARRPGPGLRGWPGLAAGVVAALGGHLVGGGAPDHGVGTVFRADHARSGESPERGRDESGADQARVDGVCMQLLAASAELPDEEEIGQLGCRVLGDADQCSGAADPGQIEAIDSEVHGARQ